MSERAFRLGVAGSLDDRAAYHVFAVARALRTAGCPAVVGTPGGLAPRRFLSAVPVVEAGAAAGPGCAFPPDDAPVHDLFFWRGAPKWESVVAFSSRGDRVAYDRCQAGLGARELLVADAEHEVHCAAHLAAAGVAVFAGDWPASLVTPREALAAGCALLLTEDWPLPDGAVHGREVWRVPAADLTAALQWLLAPAQRALCASLRHRGHVHAQRWRDAAWYAARRPGCQVAA